MNTRGQTKGVAKSTRSKAAAASAKRRHADDVLPVKQATVKKMAPAKKKRAAPKKRARKQAQAQPESTVSFQAEVIVVNLTQTNTSLVSKDNTTVHQLVSSLSQILQEHKPKTFTASFDPKEAWSSVRITLHRDSLARFPLLEDMELQTPPGTDSTVPFHPPSRIWGFVSAAALLEDPSICTQWLCQSMDLSLAADTLEVRLPLKTDILASKSEKLHPDSRWPTSGCCFLNAGWLCVAQFRQSM